MSRRALVAILHRLDQLPVTDERRWRIEWRVLAALQRVKR